MKKISKILFLILAALLLFFLLYFFVGKAPHQTHITWGVNFSQMQAEALKLDWRKNYLALLDDLQVKHVKLLTQWDLVEPQRGSYQFDDIDWQVAQAKDHGATLIYVVGMKSGRWPECHVSRWAESLSKKEQQDELLRYVKEVVSRYKNNNSIVAWQAENEPLFRFGECPWYDEDFLVKEIGLIKSLNPTRPVIVSDSGEQSLWIEAAKIGDIVGVTMYRKVWVHTIDGYGFYFNFPLPPMSYWIKYNVIHRLFGKEVITIELQAEPWTHKLLYDASLEEQEKTMNLNQFKGNIAYAQKTGIDEFYLWGAEWWYWLKEKQNKPEIWDEAKKLF